MDTESRSRPHPGPNPASHPDSPCVARCTTLYDDVCRGCGRTAMEVANWVVLDEQEKEAVWQRLLAKDKAK